MGCILINFMKGNIVRAASVFLCLFIVSLNAEPTQERVWTSTVGSTITAKAMQVKSGKVSLVTDQGRRITLALDKLSKEDQKFLQEHFKPGAIEAPEYQSPEGLDYPLGKVSEAIDTGHGSSYFLYLPTTLAAGERAPLMFWTGSGKGSPQKFDRFKRIAELAGMIVGVSVDASNDYPDDDKTAEGVFKKNNRITREALDHMAENLPVVNVERVFFSGGSGGGATAFYNASKLKSLGALPFIAYIPRIAEPPKTGLYFVGGGAWDYNRYLSANAAEKFGSRSVHRVYQGGHSSGKPHIGEEGMLWLYTRHIYEKRDEYAEELARFEARLSKWLIELSSRNPQEAYYWCHHLRESCKVTGEMAEIAASLEENLAKNSANILYLEARDELQKFSKKHLSPFGERAGSKKAHSDPKVVKAAKLLAEKYQDVPEFGIIFEELQRPTKDH